MNSRVVLADDHAGFRAVIRSMIERDSSIQVVAEAGDGIEALELVRSTRPDVLILDIEMPRLAGVDAIRQIVAAHPSIKIIVLSLHAEPMFAADMLSAGACGYVTKNDAKELTHAIRTVMSDIDYLSPEVAAEE